MPSMNALTRAVDGDRRRTVALVAAAAVVVAGVGFGAVQAMSDDNASVTPAGEGAARRRRLRGLPGGRCPDPREPQRVLAGRQRRHHGVVPGRRHRAVLRPRHSHLRPGHGRHVQHRGRHDRGDRVRRTRVRQPGVHRCALRSQSRDSSTSSLPEPQFGTCETVATTIALEHVLPDNGNFADFTNFWRTRLAAGDRRGRCSSATGWPRAAATCWRSPRTRPTTSSMSPVRWSTTAPGGFVVRRWSSSAGRSHRSARRETCSSLATSSTPVPKHHLASRHRRPERLRGRLDARLLAEDP